MDLTIDAVNAAVALTSELWSTLPACIVQVIASKLDFLTMITSRLVCKSWDSMVTSPGFRPPDPAAKCTLMAHNPWDKTLMLHNRSTNFWQSWTCDPMVDSATNLPETEFTAKFKRSCGPACPSLYDIVGTAGGLLCFQTWDIFHPDHNHIVCNPVLKTYRLLPSMVINDENLTFRLGFVVWWGLAAMLFDIDTGVYKLVVVGYTDDKDYPMYWDKDSPRPTTLKATQVYESLTSTWRSTVQQKSIRGCSTSFRKCYNKSVLYKGFLFVVTLAEPWGERLSVMIFNMEEGSWLKQFESPICDVWGPAYGSIVVSNDELYMVGTDKDFSWSTINYWKLSVPDLPAAWRNGSLCTDADSVWQLVRKISSQSPEFPISNLSSDHDNYWFSKGHNGCIYFMFKIHPNEDYDSVVTHDIAADTWTTLHFEGPTGFKQGDTFTDLHVFQPSFAQV